MTRASALLVAAAVSVLITAMTGAQNGPADGVASCSSEVLADVEVDNCVADPNAPAYGDVPRFGVELQAGVGLG